MIKKIVIGTVAILLAAVILFGRSTLSYIRTSWELSSRFGREQRAR